jgi:hypothetical protein
MNRQRYQLQIETASGISADESVRMLRAFLKCALRSYRIRCTSAERIEHGSQEGVEDPPQPTIGGERDN